MATNNEGMGGADIEHIALEKITMIGMQSPNEYPSTREGDDRVTLSKLEISPSKGCEIKDTPGYDCEPIDTSWLSYGGKYTLGVGNKWHIRVGSGGVYTETTGPIMIDGEIMINQAKKGFFVQTNLFQVIVDKRAMLSGKRIDFKFDETYFTGNVNFLTNVAINGGLYVNGELYCPHITMQKQRNTTSFNDDNQAYINPAQSFHVFNGASLAAKKYVHEGLLSGIWTAIDWTDADESLAGGMVDIEWFIDLDPILQLLPGLGEVLGAVVRQIHIPCKIAFPKGISLISDATDFQNPEAYTMSSKGTRMIGQSIQKSDTFGPGHVHEFDGPAVEYVSTTDQIYSQAANVLSPEPIPHKKAVPNGAATPDEAIKQTKEMAQSYLKKYLKQILNWFNPFSDATS